VIGGIASGRVPVGNAEGDLVTSWLNETSIALGIIAVATSAYLAAVYLAADAVRLDRPELELAFRRRALAAAVAAGVAAAVGLLVIRDDAPTIWDGLTSGAGLVAVIVSLLAGLATIVLVLGRRYGPARVSAATAVAAVIAGWGLAQSPQFLPGLTIQQAAAGRSVLIATIVALGLGALYSCRRSACSTRSCCAAASTRRPRRAAQALSRARHRGRDSCCRPPAPAW
jgi:cytochrome d ubiquinol oxidase subunit II